MKQQTIDVLLEKQSRHKKALRELAIRSDSRMACLRERLSKLEYAFNLLPVGLASEDFNRSLMSTSHLKQEDLGETPKNARHHSRLRLGQSGPRSQ